MKKKAKKLSCLLFFAVCFSITSCKKNDIVYDDYYPDGKLSVSVHSDGESYFFPDSTYTLDDLHANFYNDGKNSFKYTGLVFYNYGRWGLCQGVFKIPTTEIEIKSYSITTSNLIAGDEIGHYYIQQFFSDLNTFGFLGRNTSDYINISITKKYNLLHYVYGQKDTPSTYVDGVFECQFSYFNRDIYKSSKVTLKGYFTDIEVYHTN
jgi:hypothetical protein